MTGKVQQEEKAGILFLTQKILRLYMVVLMADIWVGQITEQVREGLLMYGQTIL